MKEEVTLPYKYTEWYVYKDGHKYNVVTQKGMTTKQALRYFKANAVVGLK